VARSPRSFDGRLVLLQGCDASTSRSSGHLTIIPYYCNQEPLLITPSGNGETLAASGAEIVTVALRRADLSGRRDPFANILDFIDPEKYLLLPNTSGALDAGEAVRLARMAVFAGLPQWVKLEIHPDAQYLLPDPIETLKAAAILVKEGFAVLPYINADPVLAKRLQDVGTATVMPLGSPLGSNRGLETRAQIEIIIKQATVPVVVDAGIGAPSDAAEALEMGADAVLVNTAIAASRDPVRMARAFKAAVECAREAFEAGLPSQLDYAGATSPLVAFLSGQRERTSERNYNRWEMRSSHSVGSRGRAKM